MYENSLNPNYSADKLGLEVITFDEQGMSYAFNTLMFVRPTGTKGQVYVAQSSGCSCPTPFEEYEGKDQAGVLSKMTQVKDEQDAARIFYEWRGSILDASAMPKMEEFWNAKLYSWFR
jgi:hypothetical protein